jgi:hypothetical protein
MERIGWDLGQLLNASAAADGWSHDGPRCGHDNKSKVIYIYIYNE